MDQNKNDLKKFIKTLYLKKFLLLLENHLKNQELNCFLEKL